MPRVIGIDPGTVSIDICGLEDGRLFLDESLPTSEALSDPGRMLARLESAGHVDLVAGPSGYGLPCVRGADLKDDDLRLAFLAPEGESGGIAGLRAFARALAASRLPVVFTPGVVHLQSVPVHRKINRIDMGTAEKVCAVALAVSELARDRGRTIGGTSFILLELGGAFTAAIAVHEGRIVDGAGGSSGPMGLRGAGALDGEVAFVAGRVSKSMIFSGGAAAVAGEDHVTADMLAAALTPRAQVAWDAYVESAVKAVSTMRVSTPDATEVVVSGRAARMRGVREGLAARLALAGLRLPVNALAGFGAAAKEGAQGGALIADGLAGGRAKELVDRLGIRDARGRVLDHLYVVSPAAARERLGMT